jgi:flavin reductase (DIM6/NTAB) family NADH-FMN oxidoreductase RutF
MWCSQASFDPPGVTVSIRKSRTLETMLMPGNPFAISMVAESQAKRVRKVRGQCWCWCLVSAECWQFEL